MKSAIDHYIDIIKSGEKNCKNEAHNYYLECETLMDKEIVESMYGFSDKEVAFLRKYCEEHFKKFQEEFIVN